MTRSIIFLGLFVSLTFSEAFAREYYSEETQIKALKITTFNRLFDRMGIEIQVALTPDTVLSGSNCMLSAIGTRDQKSAADRGTGYTLIHHGVPVGSVDPIIQWSLTARNWFSNPHVIILRCNTPRDFSLTIGEIEKDLSGAIRFYKP